ncbi:MAG TPA: hypothetical protein PLC40_13240 [Candidatus Hydrogenedentes bacterium]|nr:hypothetical protein [Candidatus Hydrogenedentota bacterium]
MNTSDYTRLWHHWKKRFFQWRLRQKCPTEFLCDYCKYDYGSACSRPERPNATRCPDYRPRV